MDSSWHYAGDTTNVMFRVGRTRQALPREKIPHRMPHAFECRFFYSIALGLHIMHYACVMTPEASDGVSGGIVDITECNSHIRLAPKRTLEARKISSRVVFRP